MLRNTQQIAIRVFEPGNFCAAGCAPNSEIVLLHEAIFFKDDTFFLETGDNFLNTRDLPSQNRKWMGLELRGRCYPPHDSVGVKDHGKLIFAEQAKTQRLLIKLLCLLSVPGGNEGHYAFRAQHGPHGTPLLYNQQFDTSLRRTLCSRQKLESLGAAAYIPCPVSAMHMKLKSARLLDRLLTLMIWANWKGVMSRFWRGTDAGIASRRPRLIFAPMSMA